MSITNTSEKIILGISCFYHDSSAVLIKGDKIIAAVQEERFSRKKFDSSFPVKSIEFCLKKAKINICDLDCVTFYEEPYLKLERLILTQTKYSPLKIFKNYKRIKQWIANKLNFEQSVQLYLPDFKGKVCFYYHHLSHAASAYYPSPFEEATILTIDGVGEWASTSIAKGKGNNIEMLYEQRFPNSVGLLYSAFTQYIGFKVDSGEYKMMGLAPYGKAIYKDRITRHIVNISKDGSIVLNMEYFDFAVGSKMINSKFESLFDGPIRLSESPITQKEMDIASSIQEVVEDILLTMVKFAVSKTGIRNLCISGGVGLNCVANGKIISSGIVDKVWVQPASGDAGGSLGSALLAAYPHYKTPRHISGTADSQSNPLLGPEFTLDEIRETLDAYGFSYVELSNSSWARHISKLIESGNVVGMFQGAMEYGPRALGSRSILGDPRNAKMQKTMNLKIKFRESFRPFAPMVLEEKASEWFDIESDSPYMLMTTTVKECKRKVTDNKVSVNNLTTVRSDIPAVTHVDYSARVQTVNSKSNPKIYSLLKEFERSTGCPILINTSFNIRGEPIVCSIVDALKCFMNTKMDYLVLENYILHRDNQPDILNDKNFKDSFKLD